jgi:hypothetical protein
MLPDDGSIMTGRPPSFRTCFALLSPFIGPAVAENDRGMPFRLPTGEELVYGFGQTGACEPLNITSWH